MAGVMCVTSSRWRLSNLPYSEAAPIDRADGVNCVGFRRALVRAVTFDPGKAQCHAAGVARARLDVVERDLDDKPRLDVHRIGVAVDGQPAQLLGLPRQRLIRQAFEGLAEHDKAAGFRVARAEMQVAQPASAPSMPPLGGQHDEVECYRRLYLEP